LFLNDTIFNIHLAVLKTNGLSYQETKMSTFKTLSKLINVNDIYEPFLGEFDNSENVAGVFDEWMSHCHTEGLDPMEQLALVKQNEETIGTIEHDDLEESRTLYECNISPIRVDSLISYNTPLLEAIQTVCSRDFNFFLVLMGNRLIGYLTFDHFQKLPFRMCLFALLIDLEKVMLKIVKSDPALYLKNLTDGRLRKAKEIYGFRRYSLDNENKEHASKLIECTAFIDKISMLKKNAVISQKCPKLKSDNGKIAETIRNSIAHPEGEESGLLPIKREALLPFIKWTEDLQKQLYATDSRDIVLL